ncbi:MAG: tetratricopeptide repeat protein [Bacteroidales bacterium]
MTALFANRGTRLVILVMIILTFIGIVIAKTHYGRINKAIDPRIREARMMYGRYNRYASENDTEMVVAILDSIRTIYLSVPHYSDSYELGVIENNLASVYLTLALSSTGIDERREFLLSAAEEHLLAGIDYYTTWMGRFGDLTEAQISEIVREEFSGDETLRASKNIDAIIRKRTRDLLDAQKETSRRLSVSYSNMGIISRHREKAEEAVSYYERALEIWSDNHVARNNLNIIFGLPPVKQSFIRRMFPPDRL